MAADISPVLHYPDIEEAVEWLGRTFGFTAHALHRAPGGAVAFAELAFDGTYVGLGGAAEEGSPFDLGPAAVYVVVDSPARVDELFERASGAGAEVVMEIVDQPYGSHEFAVRDHAANVWCFGTFRPGSSPASD
ncbi:MAG TPA: VOC family protein [Acidimicrobiales bacterium]|nr:VOC family protein [Acidimicrobiales bacterium]